MSNMSIAVAAHTTTRVQRFGVIQRSPCSRSRAETIPTGPRASQGGTRTGPLVGPPEGACVGAEVRTPCVRLGGDALSADRALRPRAAGCGRRQPRVLGDLRQP